MTEDSANPRVATVEDDGRKYRVSVRVGFDGVEYVGRLWFTEIDTDDRGLPDRAALSGRTRDEVLALASRLTSDELVKRHRRALSEKRRFNGLRRVTDEIIAKIRYMNQVRLSMAAGLLDADGAAQEVELTEQQLHTLVDKLSAYAGVED